MSFHGLQRMFDDSVGSWPDRIAVEDLLSLGDFLTLPDDDLALAEVLKSPLIGLDDDDIAELEAIIRSLKK